MTSPPLKHCRMKPCRNISAIPSENNAPNPKPSPMPFKVERLCEFHMIIDFTIGHADNVVVLNGLLTVWHHTKTTKGHDAAREGTAFEIIGPAVLESNTATDDFCARDLGTKHGKNPTHLSTTSSLYLYYPNRRVTLA